MSPKYRECLLSLTAVTSPHCVFFFQEDISKLRRKIEKAKKPAEKISNGDDILNEEINDYKVGLGGAEGNCFHSVTALSLECLFILNFLKTISCHTVNKTNIHFTMREDTKSHKN